VPRRKVANDPIAVLSGGVVSETTHGGRADRAVVRENFLPLPVDRTLELRIELGEDFDGDLDLLLVDVDVRDARVKPVVFVPEERVDLLDRETLRERILAIGAKYCKAPVVHVVRKVVRRDVRHDAEIPLEDSLRIFAEETKPRDTEEKIAFAAELAREADAGEME
jgi:hypothetical protein